MGRPEPLVTLNTRRSHAALIVYVYRKIGNSDGRMIRSFRDRNTRRFFEGHRVPAFQGFADQAVRRLTYLDSAEALQDLAGLPSNRLEVLRGDLAGQYSIRINAQWRICFRWDDDGPGEVAIVDYH